MIQMLQPATNLEQAPAVQTAMEQLVIAKLDAVDKGVTSIKHSQDLLNTKLFGDPTGENEGGRLPRLEFTVSTNLSVVTELRDKFSREVIRDGPSRMEKLEQGQVKQNVITGLLGTMGGAAVAALMHFLMPH